jgi:hypothetical protein
MTPVILAVYFTAFTILGVIALIATGDTRSEKAMLSRARRKRARRRGYVKARVHYDYRVKRHAHNREAYWQ